MIDTHHHCLPAVDDGPGDWDESVLQCRAAADDGIRTIIATPHVGRGRWSDPPAHEVRKLVSQLNEKLGGEPLVLPGSEYFFAHDMVETLALGSDIQPLAGTRYVLVEFDERLLPPFIDSVFYRAQMEGWIPVIAHPERNLAIQSNPELLYDLVTRGARAQVTAMSVTGQFGSRALKSAELLLDREMVHFMATDAHSIRRPPVMAKAYERVARDWGPARAEALCLTNPYALLRSERLPYDPEPGYAKKTGGLFRSVVRLFSSIK
jgi:protein-tyrosine phosphatase